MENYLSPNEHMPDQLKCTNGASLGVFGTVFEDFQESRRTPWPESQSYFMLHAWLLARGFDRPVRDGARVREHGSPTGRSFLGLVDEHGAAVLALLRRLCGRGHDAEDLFQDVAIRVWRNLGSRPTLRNPRGWLMTIAYRVYLDHQAQMPRLTSLSDDEAPAAPSRAGPGPGGAHRTPRAVRDR